MPAVVVKKEEKIAIVFKAMNDMSDMQEFKTKFKEFYPSDWQRIIARFRKEEQRDKKHKGHPMPEPEKYLENMYIVAYKKR